MKAYQKSLNNIIDYNSLAWDEDELIEFKRYQFEIFNDLMIQDSNPSFVRSELEKYIIDYYTRKIITEILNNQGNTCDVNILGKYRCISWVTYDHTIQLYSGGVKIIDQNGKIIKTYGFRSINPDYKQVLNRNLIPFIEKVVSSFINKIYDYAIPGIYK